MELNKVRLETLLFIITAVCLVWAATAQADVLERKAPARGDCGSAIYFSKIHRSPELVNDLRLYQSKLFTIQRNYPELSKKSFGFEGMRTEFSRPDSRIKINFSNMSSVMRLIYSLARWGTLVPVNEAR